VLASNPLQAGPRTPRIFARARAQCRFAHGFAEEDSHLRDACARLLWINDPPAALCARVLWTKDRLSHRPLAYLAGRRARPGRRMSGSMTSGNLEVNRRRISPGAAEDREAAWPYPGPDDRPLRAILPADPVKTATDAGANTLSQAFG